jgi:hypothetical protein
MDLSGNELEKAKEQYWKEFEIFSDKQPFSSLFENGKKGAGGWHSWNLYNEKGIRLELRVNINEQRVGCGIHVETENNKALFNELLKSKGDLPPQT